MIDINWNDLRIYFGGRDLWDFHNAIFIRELIVIVGDFQYFIDCFWWYWYLIKFMVNIPLTYGTVLKKISRLWVLQPRKSCEWNLQQPYLSGTRIYYIPRDNFVFATNLNLFYFITHFIASTIRREIRLLTT